MSSKTEVKKSKEAKESKEEKKRKVEEEEEDEEEDEEKRSPSNPDVVTKYRAAGDIANRALQFVQKQCVDGKRIVEICEAGDKFIMDEVGKIFNNKKLEKGLGFPVCISVNNTVGHFSPLKEDQTKLKNGDIVKIDLGAQIDGFCAVAAHTFVLGLDAATKVTGRKADVMQACYYAADAAFRLLKPGNKNNQITEAIGKIAADFKVSPVMGVLSHEMKQFVIDGEKVILNKQDADNKVEEVEFLPNEVYHIDIVMSTGEGKPKEVDQFTTVYKRNPGQTYRLKLQAAREMLSLIDKQSPAYPFSLRSFDEKKARFGIKESVAHDLVQPYPVLQEKEGDFVAHVKFTAILLPTGTVRICNMPIDIAKTQSDLKVADEGMRKLLEMSLGGSKAKAKKKAAKKKAAATAAPAAAAASSTAATTASAAATTSAPAPAKKA